jgi:hypothetical protein
VLLSSGESSVESTGVCASESAPLAGASIPKSWLQAAMENAPRRTAKRWITEAPGGQYTRRRCTRHAGLHHGAVVTADVIHQAPTPPGLTSRNRPLPTRGLRGSDCEDDLRHRVVAGAKLDLRGAARVAIASSLDDAKNASSAIASSAAVLPHACSAAPCDVVERGSPTSRMFRFGRILPPRTAR